MGCGSCQKAAAGSSWLVAPPLALRRSPYSPFKGVCLLPKLGLPVWVNSRTEVREGPRTGGVPVLPGAGQKPIWHAEPMIRTGRQAAGAFRDEC